MRRVRLTRRGTVIAVAGAVCGAGAYGLGFPELLYPAALGLLLPVAALVTLMAGRLDIDVNRRFGPAVGAVGSPVVVEVTVTNRRGRITPHLLWWDRHPEGGATEPRSFPPLRSGLGARPSGSREVLRYQFVPRRRGLIDIGPLMLARRDPFELAERIMVVGVADELVVTPPLAMLGDAGVANLASNGASLLVRRSTGGDDDLSTREYRSGDALRRVHWRATARHGELMVRQEEPRSHARATVILDTRRAGYPDSVAEQAPESDVFELALALASSITVHLSRGGFEVGFVSTAARESTPVAPLHGFYSALAVMALSDDPGEHQVGSAAGASSHPDRGHGTVFAVIGDPDPVVVERLIAHRAAFDVAVLFVIGPTSDHTLRRLRDYGWDCVRIAASATVSTKTVEAAWRRLAERGERRVG